MLYTHTVQCGYKACTHLLNCEAEKIQSSDANFQAVYGLCTHNAQKKVESSYEAAHLH